MTRYEGRHQPFAPWIDRPSYHIIISSHQPFHSSVWARFSTWVSFCSLTAVKPTTNRAMVMAQNMSRLLAYGMIRDGMVHDGMVWNGMG